MIGGSDAERFLAFEVMEEGALGDAGRGAEIIHGRRRITLGADRPQRGVKDLVFGCSSARHGVSSTRCQLKYQPVGILSTRDFPAAIAFLEPLAAWRRLIVPRREHHRAARGSL
jgi:hypothetical protein